MRAVSDDRGEDGVKLWNATDCSLIDIPFKMAGSAVQAIAFSPPGDQIAWSTDSGTIWLAHLNGSVSPLKLPALHTNHVWELDFSPDGAVLVSGGSDGKALLWSTADGNPVRTLRDGGPAISAVRFSGGGKLIAAGGAEDQIEVWDITRPKGQELVKQLPALGGANRLGFNRDGTILGFGSDARYISGWSTSSWDTIFQLNAWSAFAAFSTFIPFAETSRSTERAG